MLNFHFNTTLKLISLHYIKLATIISPINISIISSMINPANRLPLISSFNPFNKLKYTDRFKNIMFSTKTIIELHKIIAIKLINELENNFAEGIIILTYKKGKTKIIPNKQNIFNIYEKYFFCLFVLL